MAKASQREHQECLERCDRELGSCLSHTLYSPSDGCNQRYKDCEKSCAGLLGEGQET